MSTKLEMIEMLRKRINVSYEEANEALERCNGDVVAALIYLEKNHKTKAEPKKNHRNGYGIIRWIKDIIRKGNRTKLSLIKDCKVRHSIPLTLLVLVTVIAPQLTVIAFLIALFTEYRFEIIKANGENMDIKKAFDDVVASVNKAGKEVTVQDGSVEDKPIKLQ